MVVYTSPTVIRDENEETSTASSIVPTSSVTTSSSSVPTASSSISNNARETIDLTKDSKSTSVVSLWFGMGPVLTRDRLVSQRSYERTRDKNAAATAVVVIDPRDGGSSPRDGLTRTQSFRRRVEKLFNALRRSTSSSKVTESESTRFSRRANEKERLIDGDSITSVVVTKKMRRRNTTPEKNHDRRENGEDRNCGREGGKRRT